MPHDRRSAALSIGRRRVLKNAAKARRCNIRRLRDTFWVRFWEKVNRSGPIPKHQPKLGRCWEWTKSVNHSGYVQIKKGGVAFMAHRLVWELFFAPIPEGKQVLHKCDNPKCQNPKHLFLGTAAVNVQDCINKGRRRYAAGQKHHLAKLTDEQVAEIRKQFNGSITVKDRNALASKYSMHPISIANIVYSHRRLPRHLSI